MLALRLADGLHVGLPLRVVGSGGRVWLVWSHTGAIADVPLKALESRLGPAVEVETQWAIRVFRFGP